MRPLSCRPPTAIIAGARCNIYTDVGSFGQADSSELLGLSTQLGHKAENHSLEDRLKQLRQEIQADSKSKLSRAEVVKLLAAKADVSDVESSFSRTQQNINSVRLQVRIASPAGWKQCLVRHSVRLLSDAPTALQLESMVQAETEQRKSDAVALRKHVDADFDGHYEKMESKVRHWRMKACVRAPGSQ